MLFYLKSSLDQKISKLPLNNSQFKSTPVGIAKTTSYRASVRLCRVFCLGLLYRVEKRREAVKITAILNDKKRKREKYDSKRQTEAMNTSNRLSHHR
jgi:hypothetical protein